MGLFNKLKKDDVGASAPIAQSIDEKGNIVQMIQAEVIEVGPEVTDEEIDEEAILKERQAREKKHKNHKPKYKPIRFSYRYKFTDPETGEIKTGYDDLSTVQIGEQIYDVGEKLYILYSNTPNKETGDDFTVTRKLIFPESLNKKKKLRKIVKLLYYIILFGLIFACMCASFSQQPLVDNSTLTEEEISEIESMFLE